MMTKVRSIPIQIMALILNSEICAKDWLGYNRKEMKWKNRRSVV